MMKNECDFVKSKVKGKSQLRVNGKLYQWNDVYKHYNAVDDMEILTRSILRKRKE